MFFSKIIIFRIILIVKLTFIFSTTVLAQSINIKIIGLDNTEAKLFTVELGKLDLITSITSDKNANFSIDVQKQKLDKGFFRLVFTDKTWLTFIYDSKNIKMETNKNNLIGSLKIIESESNRILNTFLFLHNKYKFELDNFRQVISKSSNDSVKIKYLAKKLKRESDNYKKFINSVSTTISNSFINRYIQNSKLPLVDTIISPTRLNTYLRTHSLDEVNFNDGELIFSDAFVIKTVEYINYFANTSSSKKEQEEIYCNVADTILNKAKVNKLVYQALSEYLIEGFRRLELHNVVDYIIENYVLPDDLCLDESIDNSIQMRIDQSKNFPKGTVVPNIILPDLNGNEKSLYNVTSKYKLVLFYTSHCPHCNDLMPKLLEFYSKKKNELKIFAISLDEEKSEFENYIFKNDFPWINVSDLKGWKSKPSFEYYIFATPTMFLVDEKNKLIAKPKSASALISLLN